METSLTQVSEVSSSNQHSRGSESWDVPGTIIPKKKLHPQGGRTGGDWQMQVGHGQKGGQLAPEVTKPGSDFLFRNLGRGFGK